MKPTKNKTKPLTAGWVVECLSCGDKMKKGHKPTNVLWHSFGDCWVFEHKTKCPGCGIYTVGRTTGDAKQAQAILDFSKTKTVVIHKDWMCVEWAGRRLPKFNPTGFYAS